MHEDDATFSEKVYVKDINIETFLLEIRHGLQFINFKKNVPPDSTIFIKLNLTDSAHKSGVTTTPLLIKTVIEELLGLVEGVVVGESDEGNYAFSADTSLRNHGMYAAAQHRKNNHSRSH
jgi:uncharacterized protein (DUF362 family)